VHALARGLLCGAAMRTLRVPALLLLSVLSLSPSVHAAKPETSTTITAAAELAIEIAEVTKDGARKTMTLTLLLPDVRGNDRPKQSELKTRVDHNERQTSFYWARVQPESTSAGVRYEIDVRRASDSQYNNTDLRMEVTRVLAVGVATQIGRVARPDGSTLIVTATLR
jgi:hypothetical protein